MRFLFVLAFVLSALIGVSSAGVGNARLHSAAMSISSIATWTNVTRGVAPVPMAGAMMAYSPAHHRFVLFGGWDGVTGRNETWVFDPLNLTWTELHPALLPESRGDEMFVYDSDADLFILFGGWHEFPNGTYVRLDDTWTFSLTTRRWIQAHPSVSPSARSDAMVAYDAHEEAVLLFGGFDGSRYLGDLWSYMPMNNTWARRSAAVLPSPRADGRMVYVPGQDRFILFGGNDFTGPNLTFHHLADTWSYAWTRNVWTALTTTGAPSARDYPILAEDPAANLLLLTSGYGDRVILNDLWTFNLTTNVWSNVTPPSSPPPRFAGTGDFAPDVGVLVIFSGAGDSGLLADTWTYQYGTTANSNTSMPVSILAAIGLGTAVLLVGVAVLIWRRNVLRRPPKT